MSPPKPASDRVITNILTSLEKLNWSHAKLAEMTGIHKVLMSKYLRRESTPGIDAIERISAKLGISLADLLGPTGSLPKPQPIEPGNVELLAAMAKLQARIDELEAQAPTDPRLKAILERWDAITEGERNMAVSATGISPEELRSPQSKPSKAK